ncbi:MAG TPA: hypothetical protein VIV60_02195 [Polyangiaceae bacterium]
MDIRIGRRAQRLVDRENSWWLDNADYPLTFEEEFENVLLRLRDVPMLGVSYPTAKRPHLQRVLLPKSKCHIYYTLENDKTLIVIHSVWGACRKRGPKL